MEPKKCPVCEGEGWRYAPIQSQMSPQIKCHACGGKGWILMDDPSDTKPLLSSRLTSTGSTIEELNNLS